MIKKILLVLFLIFMVGTVWADMYLADPIAVQADGDNPVQAKQLALEHAQRQSFAQVLRRLMGRDLFTQEMPISDIVNLVQDVSIQNEKNTAQTYWATVRVRFQPDAVRNFLNAHNQSYLKSDPPSFLVIPVQIQGTEIVGLEDENSFYQLLRSKENLSDFYQMVLPVGDLDEMVMVNRALRSKQYDDLLPLTNRYGTEAVLIVFASAKGNNDWRFSSIVIPEDKKSSNVEIDDWYNVLSLNDGWERLLSRMEEDWRLNDVVSENQNDTYYARLNENSLMMWAQDEKAFRKMEFLKDFMLRGVYQHQMLFSFSFTGTRSELIENWDQAGWVWHPDMTGPSGTLTRKEVYYE